MECRNCTAQFEGNYCPQCGQRPNEGRIVLKESLREAVEHYFDLDAPLLRTVRDLILRPGTMIRDYIRGRRKRYSHPIRYFLMITAIYLILKSLTGFDPVETFGQAIGNQNGYDPSRTDSRASTFFSEHINSFLFIFVFLLGSFSRLFFRRSGFNISEHLTLSLYAISEYLFIATFVMLGSLLEPKIFFLNYAIVLLYPAFVLFRFHEGNAFSRSVKSIIAVILSWLLYILSGFFLALVIVVAFKI